MNFMSVDLTWKRVGGLGIGAGVSYAFRNNLEAFVDVNTNLFEMQRAGDTASPRSWLPNVGVAVEGYAASIGVDFTEPQKAKAPWDKSLMLLFGKHGTLANITQEDE